MAKSTSVTAKNTLKRLQKKDADSSLSSSNKGLPRGWTRSTFLVREEHLKKLKTVAFLGETSLKDVLDKILESFFVNKNIKISPKKNLSQFLELNKTVQITKKPGSPD